MTQLAFKRLAIAVAVGLGLILLSGCANGNKQQLASVAPALTITSSYHIVVGVQDRRPYVLNHDKTEDFVGLQRSVYGIPYDVRTQSGHPLAGDFRDAIVAALKNRNITTDGLNILPAMSDAAVQQAAVTASADRLLYVRIDEWKADTAQNTALYYDLHLAVLDRAGKVISELQRKGDDNLGGDGWDPVGHAAKVVPEALQRILESLLNDPKIVEAFK
jgi:hypothetical protein